MTLEIFYNHRHISHRMSMVIAIFSEPMLLVNIPPSPYLVISGSVKYITCCALHSLLIVTARLSSHQPERKPAPTTRKSVCIHVAEVVFPLRPLLSSCCSSTPQYGWCGEYLTYQPIRRSSQCPWRTATIREV